MLWRQTPSLRHPTCLLRNSSGLAAEHDEPVGGPVLVKETGLASFWRSFLWALASAALLCALVVAAYMTGAVGGASRDGEASTKKSANGLFVVRLAPEAGKVKPGELHSWLLTLKTAAGKPVEFAAIDISGGMPQHRQGLPTSPQATDYLGQGRYRIEGLKFTTSGWWQLRLAISAAPGSDTVVFNVVL